MNNLALGRKWNQPILKDCRRILLGMSQLTSAAKAAALIVDVLIVDGVAGLAYADQRPGDCGYYINGNGHRVPNPCGTSKTIAPPPGATAICLDGAYSFSVPLMRKENASTMAASRAI